MEICASTSTFSLLVVGSGIASSIVVEPVAAVEHEDANTAEEILALSLQMCRLQGVDICASSCTSSRVACRFDGELAGGEALLGYR